MNAYGRTTTRKRAVPVIRLWNETARSPGQAIDDTRVVRDDPVCIWLVIKGDRVGLLDRAYADKHGVSAGTLLTEELIERIDTEVRDRLCDRSAVRMLAARSHSAAMLERKLVMRGHDRSTAVAVSKRWTERGAIDDVRFAESTVRNELARKPAGRRLLESKLAAKGVSRADAAPVISAALADRDELADALLLARKSVASLKRSINANTRDPAVVKRRTLGRLARRGFSNDAVRRAVEIAMREGED